MSFEELPPEKKAGWIAAYLPEIDPEIDCHNTAEAEAILTACFKVQDRKNCHPSEIKAILSGLDSGYGEWLDTVERAVIEAPDFDDDQQRAAVLGAFRMARAFLFDICGHGPGA